MKITQKILQDIIKEEVSKMLKEEGFVEDDYRVGDLPANKIIDVKEAVPEIIKELATIKTRLRKLEEAQSTPAAQAINR